MAQRWDDGMPVEANAARTRRRRCDASSQNGLKYPRCIISPLKTIAILLAALALVSCGDKSTNIPCTAGQSSRDLTLLQAQTYRVLTIMRRLTFDATPWTSGSLYAWIISSIQGIRYRGDDIVNSFCCDPVDTILPTFVHDTVTRSPCSSKQLDV